MNATRAIGALLVLSACTPRAAATTPRTTGNVAYPDGGGTFSSAAGDAGLQAADARAADSQAPSRAPPRKVERSGTTWPFHPWDRAEAVAFNMFPMRPGVPLLAYDDTVGFSPHVVERRPLDAAHAKRSVEFVVQTLGEVEVSKCPFPRHAVVLFDGDLAVASINVCFQCGDILLWPRFKSEVDDATTDKERERFYAKQMKLYDRVFPKWQAFFRDEVGLPIDAKFR